MDEEPLAEGRHAAEAQAPNAPLAEPDAAEARTAKIRDALRESEARYRHLAEHAGALAFTLDGDDAFTYVSPALEQISGRPAADLVGQPLSRLIHRADRRHTRKHLEQARAGLPTTAEFRLIAREGAVLPMRASLRAVLSEEAREAITGVLTDITEQRREDHKIRVLNNFYEQVLNAPAVQVSVYDAEGRYRFITQSGIADAEGRSWIIGRLDEEYFLRRKLDPNLGRRRTAFVRQCVRTGRTYHIEEGFPNPAGEIRQYQRSFSPIKDLAGEVVQVVSWGMDITEHKRTEAALRHAQNHLEARVRERTQELESFAYSVSHDLRAPLRAINGFAEILNYNYRDRLDEEGRRYLDNIIEAGLFMDQLILDLLAYSRLGRTALDFRPVALDQVFYQIKDAFTSQIMELQAEVVIPPALPVVYGDAMLIRQVFLNLIDNALLYRRTGTPPRVEITFEEQESMIQLGVTDNGIGIPQDYQDKIFRVFQRLHSPEDIPGTGIGLAIVEKCVSLLEGTLRVTSEEGQGSTFYVGLPKVPA